MISSLFSLLIVMMFVQMIKELGGEPIHQKIGLLVLMFYTVFYRFQGNLFRDFGYYAFALLSLWFFIHFLRTRRLYQAISWSLAITISSLFRVEGAILTLLLPLALLFRPKTSFVNKCLDILKLYSLNLALMLLLIIWMLYSKQHLFTLGKFNDVLSMLKNPLSNLVAYYKIHVSELQAAVLDSTNNYKNADLFLVGGTLYLFVYTVIKTLSPLYTVLCYYGYRYKLIPADPYAWLALMAYLLVNFAIVFIFNIQNLFLTGRYLMLLSFGLMFAMPFSLLHIYKNWRTRKPCFTGRIWVFPLIVGYMCITAATLIFNIGPSKTYIIHAGDWVVANTPTNSRFFTDEQSLVYYAHRPGTRYPEDFPDDINNLGYIRLKNTNLNDFDYFGIMVRQRDLKPAQTLFTQLNLQSIKVFTNNFGDKVYILKKASK